MSISFNEKIEEIINQYGSDVGSYNIFRVLKISKYEVSTHSRFLGDLMNPKSRYHHNGEKNLKMFVCSFFGESFFENYSNCNIKLEHPLKASVLSKIEDYDEKKDYGRLDILIENLQENKAIVIENKIYAKDQNEQLRRYFRYCKQKYDDFRILYLSLNNKIDSKVLELDPSKFCEVFYKDGICEWLNKCFHATENADEKSIINQYIQMIQYLSANEHRRIRNRKIQFLILKYPEESKLLKHELNYAISANKQLYNCAKKDILKVQSNNGIPLNKALERDDIDDLI